MKMRDIPREVVEDGLGHPLVDALVREMRKRLLRYTNELTESARTDDPSKLRVLAGRIAELKALLSVLLTEKDDE